MREKETGVYLFKVIRDMNFSIEKAIVTKFHLLSLSLSSSSLFQRRERGRDREMLFVPLHLNNNNHLAFSENEIYILNTRLNISGIER